MPNWYVQEGDIYADFLNGSRVGAVRPGHITFVSKVMSSHPDKVLSFIKGHQKEIGANRMITVTAPFAISVDGLRKVAGGKKQGKWVYQYKPDGLKVKSVSNAAAELEYEKKIKAKLTKYIKQLGEDVKSIEKMKRGLTKLRDGL